MKIRLKPHERVTKCGAKTRQNTPCQGFAMHNGRCRLHGGLSTGPKTKEGRERIGKAQYKHGLFTKQAKLERLLMQLAKKQGRDINKQFH